VRALVFDFDGLLMDTESTMWSSWQFEWRQHGLELERERFFADHGGDVTEERYAALAAAVGAAYDRAVSHARRVAYRDRLNAALRLADGLSGWLDRAAELGLLLAVASSSRSEWVRAMLGTTGYLERFDVIATGDQVAAHKPDPAVYLLALDELGVAADQAIAFEDTPHGVAAAKAAGMRCVAIPNPHADRARFGQADVVLRSAAELSLDELLATF
jgi:putative hydrolase of the HAD superfamily